MTSNVFYTLLKDDNTEDGVGEFWTEEQAMAHVKRCAWVENYTSFPYTTLFRSRKSVV